LSIKNVIVDIESINPPANPAESASIIESLANSIIELRGLLRPPVLRSAGIDEYELIAGQLEFCAYLQARKFDESLPDRLTAFIVDKKHEDAIDKQLITISSSPVAKNTSNSTIDLDNLGARLDRLFSAQQDFVNTLQISLEQSIDHVIPEPFMIFQAINQLPDTKVSVALRSCLAKLLAEKTNAKNPKSKKIVDLLEKTKQTGATINSFAALVKATTVNNGGKKTRTISNKTILEILDGLKDWSIEYLQSESSFKQSKTGNLSTPVATSNITELQQLESQISLGFKSIGDRLQLLQDSLIHKIDQSFPEPIEFLAACMQINDPTVVQQFTKKLAFLGDAKLTKIVETLQKAHKKDTEINSFKSLQKLLINPQTKTKLLSDQKIMDVLDRWHQ
jgi:hypothetical protein